MDNPTAPVTWVQFRDWRHGGAATTPFGLQVGKILRAWLGELPPAAILPRRPS